MNDEAKTLAQDSFLVYVRSTLAENYQKMIQDLSKLRTMVDKANGQKEECPVEGEKAMSPSGLIEEIKYEFSLFTSIEGQISKTISELEKII